MLKEAWDSFKDNIKERITNPFLGTFVLVWIVHNWKVVYAFFFFDKEYNLEKKIKFFKDYWADKSFIWNLVVVAIIAIAILILTYLFLGLSRYLSNMYENLLVPQIAKFTKGKIVLDETYQKVLSQIKILESRLEEERKAKVEAIQEREIMETKLYKNNSINDGAVAKDEKVESSKTQGPKNDYKELLKKVKRDPNLSRMGDILLEVSKKIRFDNEAEARGVDFLIKNGFVYHERSDSYGRYYNFTEDGLEFKKQYFSEL